MDESPRPLDDDPETYRECFLGSTDAITITDVRGRIVIVNPAWLALYGYTLEEARGQSTSLVQSRHTTREMYVHMWTQIADPAIAAWRGEIVNRTKSGVEVPVLLTITPIRRDGVITGYMGIGIDMTERRRSEELRVLYDMVVRHDLKAPLATIIPRIEMFLDGYLGDLRDEQRHSLERMLRAARQMQEMIATSLDLEKLRRERLRLDLADVDLFATVRASFDNLGELAARRSVALRLFAGPEVAGPDARRLRRLDPVHLQRCTDNLVKNAVEAAPTGSEVRVTIETAGDVDRIRVRNGGAPIPPDVRATLFHPFSTFGKRGGTGLGIYGVKLLTEAMGGVVRYETGEGGTFFELEFGGPPPSPS